MTPIQNNDDIISTTKLLLSSKLSSNQSTMLLSSLMYSIILSTDIFRRNIDIEPFLLKIFNEWLPDHQQFRPYVYKSRTLLGSKVSRIILESFDYDATTVLTKKLMQAFAPNSNQKPSQGKNRNSLESSVTSWLSALGGGKNEINGWEKE